MELNLGIYDKIKLGTKLLNHKVLQYRLTTKDTEVLRIANGQIRGVRRLSVYGDSFYAFEGIPYAKPPLGELRFRAPQPAEPWDGVLDCMKCKSKPLQHHIILPVTEGSEDCLYLNVYTRQLHPVKPLPVMVWIYGGGFHFGEATRDIYSPDYFMREDVVLVTINYRLGSLGFLSLTDPDLQVPGNAGLKDQLLALRWVRQNIGSFSGDPSNVTLFGESAGGASTHLMMLAEGARGLFHKAILQSGTALCPWARQETGHLAYRLARHLGYDGENNDKEVFRYLSRLDGSRLASSDLRLLTSDELGDFKIISFGPVVEPYLSEDCILPRDPVELMRSSWSNEIPVLMGGCSFEGLFSFGTKREQLQDLGDCERLVPVEVRRKVADAGKQKALGLRLRRAHFNDKDPNAEESFFHFLDAMSYKMFWHGIHRTLRSRLAHASSHAPTFLYRFDFDSPDFNQFRQLRCGTGVRGVSHADDISYLFFGIPGWKLPADSIEFRTIERMVAMWTSFAKRSDPNCDAVAPNRWQPVRPDDVTHKCLNIVERLEFVDLPEAAKLRVWDSLYEGQTLI